MSSFYCDASSSETAIIVDVTDGPSFVALLRRHLHATYQYRTGAQVATTVPTGKSYLIGDGLLGSISEFCVYVIRREQDALSHPFIHCFRAADPLGSGNFPLVDISSFHPEMEPARDRLYLQEVKATRESPAYFGRCEDDFEELFAKGRLASTAEHLKWNLQRFGYDRYVPRVNDCLGTCPEDSTKVMLVPTGVSGDGPKKDACVRRIETIVGNLKGKGWSSVSGMYLRVPAIEQTFMDFACGRGCSR